jgi:hypothetical protein
MENKVAILFHPSSCTCGNLSRGLILKTAVLDIPAKESVWVSSILIKFKRSTCCEEKAFASYFKI